MTEEFNFYSKTSLKLYNFEERIKYQLEQLNILDSNTKQHSYNVACITCRICEYLKLDTDFTIYCTTCAYLHDIGKSQIPLSILRKKNRLTDEEFEIFKTHTTIGYNICMSDPKLKDFAKVPLFHHEALNGTGYPNKVTEENIPLEAKIVRVADEFEALTTKNKYKTHIGIVEVLNLIIDYTKPIDINISESLEILANDSKIGKIDRKIVRALFKVVIDDIEYEILQKNNYISYLKQEMSRLEQILILHKKIKKKGFVLFKRHIKKTLNSLLKGNENFDAINKNLEKTKNKYNKEKEIVTQLYEEIKKIKQLTF